MNERAMEAQLDEIDRKILRILQENGRATNAAIAEAVGLTPTPTLQRIKRLEQAGVVARYVAVLDRAALGFGTMAFVHVKLAQHRLATHTRFLEAVSEFGEVLECHHVAGEDDFLLKVVVPDIAAYERFLLHGLTSIADIDRVRTTFVLSTSKSETAVPIKE